MSRPLPVMFIHGFNGDPGDWTDGGFRQYLIEQGDLNPELVRVFRYGVASDGTYNNRGDVRQIASRLAGVGLDEHDQLSCSVDRLSADSVARGGPAQVTLIAHSMGGIIARYYLSRRTPDEFGTVYRGGEAPCKGNVGRLIQIASPNRGVDLLRLTGLAPRDSLPWRFIRWLEKRGLAPALPATAIEAWEAALNQQQLEERGRIAPEVAGGRVLLTDTPVYQQLHPDSPLLAGLNVRGTMPDHVECHTFYGDICFRVRIRLRRDGPALLAYQISFGDLAVPAYSAREIPGANATAHAYIGERGIEVALAGEPAGPETRSLRDLLPDISHGKLLANQMVQAGVLAALG